MADRDGFDPSFLSAAASCALRDASADAATLKTYFQTNLRYVDPLFYTNLFNRLVREVPSDPRVVTVAKETSQALPVIDFVYMDVGCWAGAGNNQETKAKGWTKHREFGVICGYMILLCAFVPEEKPNYYDRYSNPQAWDTDTRQLAPSVLIDATLTRHPDWPRIADAAGHAGKLCSQFQALRARRHGTHLHLRSRARAQEDDAHHDFPRRHARAGRDQFSERAHRAR